MKIEELKDYLYSNGFKDKNPNVVHKCYGTNIVGSTDYKETFVEYWFIPKHDKIVMHYISEIGHRIPTSIATISELKIVNKSLDGFRAIKDKELHKLK